MIDVARALPEDPDELRDLSREGEGRQGWIMPGERAMAESTSSRSVPPSIPYAQAVHACWPR